jgi:Tfp pilus assembly protein PilF
VQDRKQGYCDLRVGLLLLGFAACASTAANTRSRPVSAEAVAPRTEKKEAYPPSPSIGWQLLKEGRFDEARRVFEEDLRNNPGSVASSRGLAEAYRQSGDLERAAVALRQTAAMDPSNAEVHVALSEVYGQMKQFGPAKDESMEALQRDVPPEVGAVLKYNMACYEARLGNQRSALWWLRQALEAGFNNYEQLQTDPDLESLRTTSAYRELLAP